MSVIQITSENIDEIIAKGKPVLIDAYATWCGPCKMMAPIVEKIADDLEDAAIIGKCDIDQQPEIAQRYGIMSIPTLLYFKDGKYVNVDVGVTPEKDILEKLL